MKTFCYHGRDSLGKLLFSGIEHAANWEEAAEKVAGSYGVRRWTLGGGNWIDKDGREVRLYLSILPDLTKRGAVLLEQERQKQADQYRKQREQEEAAEQALQDAIAWAARYAARAKVTSEKLTALGKS